MEAPEKQSTYGGSCTFNPGSLFPLEEEQAVGVVLHQPGGEPQSRRGELFLPC